jgi:hypothetical protein
MSEISGKKLPGTFNVDGKNVFGELTVEGVDSGLRLRSEQFFNIETISDGCVQGTLHDLVKVSLFGCISAGIGHAGTRDQRYFFAKIFPHIVISGRQHLKPSDETISAIQFVIDDAATLFCDFDAFGTVLRPENYIESIAQANKEITHRDVKTGSEPEIVYFAGHREIFKAETAIGTVSASHNPECSLMGGPRGVFIKNHITVEIAFVTPVNLDKSLNGLLALVRYIELLIGRQQNILDIAVILGDGASHEQYLKVDWSMVPQRRASSQEEREPHSADILLNPIDDTKIFGDVLSAYLDREKNWKAPRIRFAEKFKRRNSYDLDRLIAAANLFDILPTPAFPPSQPIAADLSAARVTARTLFKALPQSADRDTVLNALGRIGKSSLKKKIAERVRLISQKSGAHFPELAMVTEKAVNCRNYFVHGGQDPDFDYMGNIRIVWFFVDTLEFVFGASDLIDAGWNIAAWLPKGTMMFHPFGEYKTTYLNGLDRLKQALAGGAIDK